MPTFSIIIPTIGRAILGTLLQEVVSQLEAEDEVLVIGDGRRPEAEELAARADSRVQYLEIEAARCWGHPQRNWAMMLAKGSHLLSLDDDDALRPGALAAMRSAAARFPDRPLVFRMQHGGKVLWQTEALTCGNVSTQMFVVPNVADRLGTWGRRYEGDFDFIYSTVMRYPRMENAIVWREEITTLHGFGGGDPRGNAPEIP